MNKSLYRLFASVTVTSILSFCSVSVDAKLIPINPVAGVFKINAREQNVKINGQTVHAMIYEDVNNPLAAPDLVAGVYNEGVPIPVMRLAVGDSVICEFTNFLPDGEIPEGASIHWHGIELDNDSDGTAVTQDTLKSGQKYTYRFTVTRPGLFWFHSHMVPGDTLFAGMYGVIIVQTPCEKTMVTNNQLPADPGGYGPTNSGPTITLAMSDTEYLDADFTNPVGAQGSLDFPVGRSWTKGTVGRKADAPPRFQTINEWIHECANAGANAQPVPCRTAVNPGNVMLVNGYEPGTVATPNPALLFEVKSGQMLRLRLYNECLTRSLYLKLDPINDTERLVRIGGQGGLLDKARVEGGTGLVGAGGTGWDSFFSRGSIVISSGVRADMVTTLPVTNVGAVFTLWGFRPAAGTPWPLSSTVPAQYPIAYFKVVAGAPNNPVPIGDKTNILARGSCPTNVSLSGPTNNLIDPPPCGGTNSTIISLNSSAGTSKPAIDTLSLTVSNPLDGNEGNGAWLGITTLPTTRYARVGDMLQLSVRNETGGNTGSPTLAHPYHLHGFSMQPVAILDNASGNPKYTFDYKEFLDTIDIYGGETLVFNVKLEDRPKTCDTGVGGPVLMPCGNTGVGGAVGRWLYHCHIGAHGVLGMISELIVLDNGQLTDKWRQEPDASPTGVDVLATVGSGSETVADDFRCLTNGWISGVHIWGSWSNDLIDPFATFELKFWTDVPASPGHPSRPGWQIWRALFGPGNYTINPYSFVNPPEFFYNPSVPAVGFDNQVWQYDFALPQCSRGIDNTNPAVQGGFFQYVGKTYWLSVTAITPGRFGWKSCILTNRWNDDACWSPTTIGPHWTDLHYFPGHPYYSMPSNSMDMAFALDNAVTFPPPQGRDVIEPTPPTLSVTVSGGNLNITWLGGGVLQYADDLAGPWNNLDGAASPYVAPADTPQRFYRVRMP